MSENRSRYSSAPLQDLRRRPPKQQQPPQPRGQAAAGAAAPSPRSYVFLQVLLVAALYAGETKDAGASSEKIGDYSVTLRDLAAGALPNHVKGLLATYRDIAAGRMS